MVIKHLQQACFLYLHTGFKQATSRKQAGYQAGSEKRLDTKTTVL
jgi:hypothetical protein